MIFQDGKNFIHFDGEITIRPDMRAGILEMEGPVPKEITQNPLGIPDKIYGDSIERAQRIYTAYKKRNRNTGVLLSGLKGSGKTMLYNLVINLGLDDGIPVFLAKSAGDILKAAEFVKQIDQRAIVAIDEFEKVCRGDAQEALLGFLDGQMGTNVLTLMTSNSTWMLDDNLIHRPGRIYYHLEYRGIEANVIKDVVCDLLEDQSDIEHVCSVLGRITDLSYDVLMNIIGEMNMFSTTVEDALSRLNVISPIRVDARYADKERFMNRPQNVRNVEKASHELPTELLKMFSR